MGENGAPPSRTVAVCALPRVRLRDFDTFDTIQPGIQDGFTLDVAPNQWISWAFRPASPEDVEMMIRKGREHAQSWLEGNVQLQPQRSA